MLENCENTAILCLSVCISDVINKAGKCGKSIQYLCAFLNDVMSQPESRLSQHGCSLGSSDSKYFFCNTCMFFFLCFEASLNLHFSFNETYFLQSDKQTNIMRSTWHISQCFLLFSFFLLPYTCISIMCRNASTQQHYLIVLCLFLSLTFFFSLGHSSLKIQSCWIQSCSAAMDMLEWRATDWADRAMMVVLTITSSHKCWRQKTSRRYKL